jgi:hypothetical protein
MPILSNFIGMIKKILILLLVCGCRKTESRINPIDLSKVVNVMDYGAVGNGIANDTKAFEMAMDKAFQLKQQVYIPNGIFKARVTLSHDGLEMIGETQPDEQMRNGSVILGMIDCDSKKNISISNLGVDSRNQLDSTDEAAITSGESHDSTALNQQFTNLSIIGDGYLAFKHGMLCQAGSGINIKNVTVSFFYHGIAIRSSNVTVDSVYANYCGFTSIVVKSFRGFNATTENVSINHVTIKGDRNSLNNRGGTILVQSYDDAAKTNNVNIQNVQSVYGGVACVLVEQLKGIVSNVTVKNCVSENQGDDKTRACYDIYGGSNITFSNCTANNSLGYGFRLTNNASNVKVVNCFEKNSSAGAWIGKFTYLQLNGQEIIK